MNRALQVLAFVGGALCVPAGFVLVVASANPERPLLVALARAIGLLASIAATVATLAALATWLWFRGPRRPRQADHQADLNRGELTPSEYVKLRKN